MMPSSLSRAVPSAGSSAPDALAKEHSGPEAVRGNPAGAAPRIGTSALLGSVTSMGLFERADRRNQSQLQRHNRQEKELVSRNAERLLSASFYVPLLIFIVCLVVGIVAALL